MRFCMLCLTALGSFAALFVIAKCIGHKQIAQLDAFDYINGITIGSIAAEMATELEEPWKPLAALVIYGGITVLLSVVSRRFAKTRRYLNGEPVVLMENGCFFRKNMKKARLALSEFLMLCRQQGYFNLSDIQTAVFEYNGTLSILPVSSARPATPEDLQLSPKQQTSFTELVMDGHIQHKNLHRLGVDEGWLQKQLRQQGVQEAQQVFLAVCDRERNVFVYKGK